MQIYLQSVMCSGYIFPGPPTSHTFVRRLLVLIYHFDFCIPVSPDTDMGLCPDCQIRFCLSCSKMKSTPHLKLEGTGAVVYVPSNEFRKGGDRKSVAARLSLKHLCGVKRARLETAKCECLSKRNAERHVSISLFQIEGSIA